MVKEEELAIFNSIKAEELGYEPYKAVRREP
jgi:hypothetical protein